MNFWDSPMMARRATPAGAQRRGFNAARMDRFTAGWLAETTSINAELRNDLDRLRARGRDLVKNDALAAKYVRMVVAGIVGAPGFTLQSLAPMDTGEVDPLDSAAIEASFAEWSATGVCDLSGRRSFRSICATLAAGMGPDGEFLVRFVRGKAARNKWGMALQIIDPARIDTQRNEAAGNGRNAIIMGVEIDATTRPVAYHLLTGAGDASHRRDSERVPATDILHGFVADFPDQIRGVPWMAAGILTLHHLGKFEESAMLAARNGADRLGFFVSPTGEAPPMDAADADGAPISVSVPGTYDTLPEGYDFRAYESKYPDAMLADFVKLYQRRAASAFNVAYNGLANDLEGVNYGSLRGGSIDERDAWMDKQAWFIDSFLRPVFAEWIAAALLMGAIVGPTGKALPATRLDKFAKHAWQGRRWQWIDPLKDIEAARAAIRSGITSPQRVAAQTGVDIADILRELAAFEKSAKGLATIDLVAPTGMPAEPPPP